MKDLDYKIGNREYLALMLLTVAIKLADTTPSVLYRAGGVSTWMVPLLSMGFTAVSLLFLLPLLKKYKDKGLVELINMTMGKYLGFVVNMTLFLIVFIATVVNTKSYIDIITGLFFQKTPPLFLILTLVLTYCYVSSRGVDTIARVAWLITPYIKINLFLLLIINWRNFDFSFMYPLFGPGIWTILKSSVQYVSVFADIVVISVLYPYLKNFKTYRNMSFIALGFTAIEISAYILVYELAFGYPGAMRIAFPFQQFTRMAQLGVGIQHVESVFLLFWIMASIVHFATYLFTASAIFTNTINIKENEPMLLPFAGLVILFSQFIPNDTYALFIRTEVLTYSSYLILPLPFIMWGVDKLKGLVTQ